LRQFLGFERLRPLVIGGRHGLIKAVPENGETGADISNSVGGQSRGLPSNANLRFYGIGIILAL
jgi:hypothetical protein